MPDDMLWQMSACEIAAHVAKGDLSARDVTQANIDRMHARNPAMNAVVDDLSDAAMAEAARLDEVFATSGPVGPLHGVPVTIKENIDQKGRATPNGVAAMKDLIAPADSPFVRNLRNAGAIVIGEDLGTVPEGLRPRLTGRNVLGMRVLWFERGKDGGFVPPRQWPVKAAAMTGTHDTVTVAGWWRGRDIDWNRKLGRHDPGQSEAQEREARSARAAWSDMSRGTLTRSRM